MMEIGIVAICLEKSMMSSNLELMGEGHLEQIYHMFAYMQKYHNSETVFYPSNPVIYQSKVEHKDWTSTKFRNFQR